MAKLMFAEKREFLALNRIHEPRVAMYSLHKYHPVWQEIMEEERDLRRELALKNNEQPPTEITVIIPEA